MSATNYPREISHPEQNSANFAFDMGANPDLRDWNGMELFEAPVKRVREGYGNSYGKDVQVMEGRVSTEFVAELLEGKDFILPPDTRMIINMVEKGGNLREDSYPVLLDIESEPYGDIVNRGGFNPHPIYLEKYHDGTSSGMHEFSVRGITENYVIADDGTEIPDR